MNFFVTLWLFVYFNEEVVEQRKSQARVPDNVSWVILMEALNKAKAPEMSKRSELTVRDTLHCTGLVQATACSYPIIGDIASSSRTLVK